MATFPELPGLSGRALAAPLCRMVPKAALESAKPADFLFTSGRPGRYNPRGVNCLYCSEDVPTAGAELERYRLGRTLQTLVYWVHPSALVIDLGDTAIMGKLGLSPADLFVNWRGLSVPSPVLTQELGGAVANQTRLAGIRFPSDAARERGATGFNVVLFRDAVQAPSSVVVLDDGGDEVQRWPKV